MHTRSPVLLIALGLLLALLSGCVSSSRTDTGLRGHLVIVGGGLQDDNDAVMQAFVSRCADGPIGIVPTASGDGIKAGESYVERFKKFAGSRNVTIIPILHTDAGKGDDSAIAAQIRSCGGLWFTGGDQSRITAIFRPDGRNTPCYDACHAVLTKGGVIGGTSAGAAMMSDPMITGGRARRGRTNADPENTDRGVRIGQGMGFLSTGLTDQHFLERGRLPRLIEALQTTNQTHGYGVSENCALVVDRSTFRAEAIGDLGVTIVRIASPATGSTPPVIRLSLISTGDACTIGEAGAMPSNALQPLRADLPPHAVLRMKNIWNRESFSAALEEFARARSAVSISSDDDAIMLIANDESDIFIDPAAHRPPSVIEIELIDLRQNPAPASSPR